MSEVVSILREITLDKYEGPNDMPDNLISRLHEISEQLNERLGKF
ncbi:MAG: hypothetical protein NDF54_10495 [archaeon GB-1867-035]|nr:hypothetical protein [Candidatus Culexmicrobium profundum]